MCEWCMIARGEMGWASHKGSELVEIVHWVRTRVVELLFFPCANKRLQLQ